MNEPKPDFDVFVELGMRLGAMNDRADFVYSPIIEVFFHINSNDRCLIESTTSR